MMMSSFAIFPFLLFSSGLSLPLGLPPLPEDPAISRAAPETCLAYVAWAGMATPDEKSSNQTEQLLAEPEVQKFFAAIDRAILAGVTRDNRRLAARAAESAKVVEDVYPLVKTLLTRPGALFLSKLVVGPEGPVVEAGAIFNLDEKTAAVADTLQRLEKLLPPGALEKVDIQSVSAHRIKAGKMPPLAWAIHEKYLLLGLGEGALDGLLKRAKSTETAVWLAAIRKDLPVERFSSMIYVNVKEVVGQFAPQGGPKVEAVLRALGVSNVNYLASVTGLDSQETVARALIAIDGEPKGLFQLAAGKPLAAADLSPIPRDATIAVAGRFDAAAALELLLTQVEKVEPSARKDMEREIAGAEKELGIDLRDDLLKPLGDVCCLYNSPAEGGLLVTGLTGVVQVKDHARLEATLKKLTSLFNARMAEHNGGSQNRDRRFSSERSHNEPQILRTDFLGKSIYHFEIPDNGFPLAPAWCLTEKELIVATYPQQVKAYLSRGPACESITSLPSVAKSLQSGDAVSVAYCDTRKIAEYAYPLLCVGNRFLSAAVRREGIPLDASLLPSAASILPHLEPSLRVVRRTPAGIAVESRGPLVGAGGMPLVTAGLFVIGARQVPEPPRVRVQDQALPRPIAP